MTKKLTRRAFVASAVAASALAGGARGRARAAQRQRPNVLYVMADDMGWGDLSCYGRPGYRTPNLDRLAAEGVRFTQAYSASPVCTPTRCAFVTGRYPARTAVGLEEPIVGREILRRQGRDPGLPPEHPTVASLLKAAGYRTALVGKWHLGYLPKYGPTRSGFDWKYLKVDEKTERLFDLAADVREQADARDSQGEVFERLRAEHRGWEAQMLRPLPPRPAQRPAEGGVR